MALPPPVRIEPRCSLVRRRILQPPSDRIRPRTSSRRDLQFPQGRRTEAAEPSTPERVPAEPAAGNRPADPPPLAIGRTSLSGDDYTAEERVNIAVYENCNRSVVNISTKVVNQNLMLFESTEEGAGSGSVLDKQGHILTNYHVVEGAREIEVTSVRRQVVRGAVGGSRSAKRRRRAANQRSGGIAISNPTGRLGAP